MEQFKLTLCVILCIVFVAVITFLIISGILMLKDLKQQKIKEDKYRLQVLKRLDEISKKLK